MYLAHKGITASALVAAITLAASGCGNSTGGGATPEAVFEKAAAAAKKKDWKAFCGCLTEESRDEMAGSLVVMTVMMKGVGGLAALGGEEAAKEMKDQMEKTDAVLKKHGITEESVGKVDMKTLAAGGRDKVKETMNDLLKPVKDRDALIADILNAMMEGKDEKENPFKKIGDSKLSDVKIDGDSAKGTIVSTVDGEETKNPIEFKKGSDGWRIHLDMKRG
jgi:hypothetical protein